VHDVKNAVRWLRANAGKLHVDVDRVGVFGYSSGGNLACMLGLLTPADGLEGQGDHPKERADVQCVVSLSGLTDLTELHANCASGRVKGLSSFAVQFALESFLTAPPAKANGDYFKASPISYVEKTKKYPPVLLIHGTGDELIPFEQSERLYKKLKHCGATVSLLAVHDAGHELRGTDAELAEAAMIAFFERHLKRR
jgi:dipeptidyl aminopeptidase/acylaminoacyl peptidase